jgi:hypothetical protein
MIYNNKDYNPKIEIQGIEIFKCTNDIDGKYYLFITTVYCLLIFECLGKELNFFGKYLSKKSLEGLLMKFNFNIIFKKKKKVKLIIF